MADQTQQGLTAEEQRAHAAAVEARADEIEAATRPRLPGDQKKLNLAVAFGQMVIDLAWLDAPRMVRPPDSDGGRAYRPDGMPAEGKTLCSVRAVLAGMTGPGGKSVLELLCQGKDVEEVTEAFRWYGAARRGGRPAGRTDSRPRIRRWQRLPQEGDGGSQDPSR